MHTQQQNVTTFRRIGAFTNGQPGYATLLVWPSRKNKFLHEGLNIDPGLATHYMANVAIQRGNAMLVPHKIDGIHSHNMAFLHHE